MGGASMTENKNKFLAEALFKLSSASEWELQDGKIKQWFKGERPTEEEIDAEVKKLQDEYDALQYQRDREYPAIGEQLDMLFHDMTAGKGSKDGEWYKAVAKVKADNPKPE